MGMEEYKLEAHPVSKKEAIIQGDCYRITMLTSALVRLEYNSEGVFEDRATQSVLNRDFPVPEFKVVEDEEELVIYTDSLEIHYNRKPFAANGLSIKVVGGGSGWGRNWNYGDEPSDLLGTARTLDGCDGAMKLSDDAYLKGDTPMNEKYSGKVKMEHGIISRKGFAVVDDSHSMALTEDGWVSPRQGDGEDLYFFGYGHRYLESLKDFYYLCGKQPLLPRYAFGNWWSRYHRYTEEEYKELVERFEDEKLPFSVAVVDMDWHIVDDVDPKYGSGWTGYTWNKNFFPDPKGFMSWLHEHNMKITLNVHPADGIRAYEELYPRVAEKMGIDPESEIAVQFDPADPHFMEVYLKDLHHPLEEEGVDFWWLDWQQGTVTKVPGLDPLWMLNHYHFLDSGRDGKRPMTFSRYAGPGSHRYPVGFSGDTHITWESLDFQPYFTSTASNIGYGWWSHDIGGHMLGYRDDELEARWYQYGVFSPINRLHSSNSAFSGKEPWNFSMEVRSTMDDFLRLRHKLVPYLYTMNYRAWKEDTPIVVPMYYDYPETVFWGKNQAPNQYFFGRELMVTPVTTKCIPELKRAKTKVWLPEGTWFDFFNGMIYEGGRSMDLYRTLEEIPVLAKAGAIIPMTEKISALDVESNPDELTVRVYAGADNTFALYEDDNTTMAYEKDDCAKTSMTLDWGARKFTIAPVEGNQSLVPESRMYCVEFGGSTAKEAKVFVNGVEADAEVKEKDGLLTIAVTDVKPQDTVTICLPEDTEIAKNDVMTRAMDLLLHAEISYITKEQIANLLHKADGKVAILAAELQSMELSNDLRGALLEIITA